MSAQPPFTSQTQATGVGKFNRTAFLVEQILKLANIATLVRVEACTNAGGLAPTGTVDVTPLVNQIDSQGNPTPHGVVHGLLYLRVQGGSNAVIMDPQPGDIGICVFSDRDLSAVKAAKAPANPGSFRRNDYADGMYLGGWGNAAPTQYVQFTSGGINIVSPTQVTLEAPVIQLAGDVRQTGAGTVTANYGTGASVTLTGHQHAQGNDGHGDAEVPTNAPTPGT